MLLGRWWSTAGVVAGVLIGSCGCGFVAERGPSGSTAPATARPPHPRWSDQPLTSSPSLEGLGIPRAQAAWWLTLPDRSGLPRPETASPAARMLSAALVSALPCQAHRVHRKLAWFSRFPALTC